MRDAAFYACWYGSFLTSVCGERLRVPSTLQFLFGELQQYRNYQFVNKTANQASAALEQYRSIAIL